LAFLTLCSVAALADSDDNPTGPAGPNLNAGLQPILGPVPRSTSAAGESPVKLRLDGVYAAAPVVVGTTKTFHLTARPAPWALRKGLRVLANTYNGVVPGPALIVNEGDEVIIDYHNDLKVPDTIHLHGIHGGPVEMDGVAGISQPLVPPGGSFTYQFHATQPGTFIYHSHDNEAILDSGLYGAIVVLPKHPRPEERVDRDYIEVISSWQIQSVAENHFTINGREYPATSPIEVKEGQRIRIRWINISGEQWHTMHTISSSSHETPSRSRRKICRIRLQWVRASASTSSSPQINGPGTGSSIVT
jgi:FtsP/CotA-like multicopper oxidase with cupredoxin domain